MKSSSANNLLSTRKLLEWESIDKGVERKILGHDDQVMMVCVRFEKGAIGSLHHHVHQPGLSYVESGRFEVNIDGKKLVLEKGNCSFAPDLVHGVVALEIGTLVDVFAPARIDFLK